MISRRFLGKICNFTGRRSGGALALALLDAGSRMDVRDDILKSTPQARDAAGTARV
jgi:hypothetical protein